jgi:hypothetical protein
MCLKRLSSKLFLLLAITLLVTSASGFQPYMEWSRTFGGPYDDGAWSLQKTEDSGYIIAGYTSSRGEGSDLWLIKTDSVGNRQWDKTFGGPKDDVGMSVVQTRDGGYIVAGRTASFGSGGDDIWFLKVDPEGLKQWNSTFGGQKDDVVLQVIELKDGYALTGRTESADSGGKKAFLLKTDLNGRKLWERYYGQNSSGISLQQTDDGGFIIAGSMNSPAIGKDAMLIKTDPFGNEQWIMPLGGPGENIGTSVVKSIDGGYVMAGITNSYGAGAEDAWLVKVKPENVTTASGNAVNMTSKS